MRQFQFFSIILVLYVISTLTSMAGMEAFSGLIAAAFCLVLFMQKKWQIKPLCLGRDILLLIILISIFVGGLLVEGSANEKFYVMGQARWILILYALTTFLYLLRDKWMLFLKTFLVSAFLVGLYSSLQTFMGFDIFRSAPYMPAKMGEFTLWRAKGFFSDTMAYAYCAGTLFCVFLSVLHTGVMQSQSIVWRRFSVLATAVLGLSLLLTFTRGAWLGLLIAIPAMWLLANPKKAIRPILISLVVLLLAGVFFKPVRDRFLSMQKIKSSSISQRFDLWRANWAMFKDNPWFGVGYNQNSKRTQEYHQKVMGKTGFVGNAHNNLLQWLGGTGIFATMSWLGFMLYLLWLSVQLVRRSPQLEPLYLALALGAFGAQIFFHIGGLTQATFFDKEAAHMFFFWIATLLAMRQIQKQNDRKAKKLESTT